MLRYLFNLAIALDQVGNALLGGYANETLSARAARAMHAGRRWGCIFCKLADLIHRDHCRYSYRRTLAGARDMAARFSRSEKVRPHYDPNFIVQKLRDEPDTLLTSLSQPIN